MIKKQNIKLLILGFIAIFIIVIFTYHLVKDSIENKDNTTIKIASNTDINGLDPTKKEFSQTAIGNRFFRCIHDNLLSVKIDEQNNEKIITKLVDKCEKKGKEITFTLRNNAYFHNGEKVTFEDIEFSINRGKENKNDMYSFVENIQKIDNIQFKITLKNDVVFWDFYFTHFIRILNKKAVEKNPNESLKIGTGPYKLKEWVPNDFILLERFDKYYNGGTRNNAPEKILIKIIPDPDTVLQEIEQGNIDATFNYPFERITDLESQKLSNIKIIEGEGISAQYCYINKQSTTLEVRKAITKALDISKYIKDLQLKANPLESYIPNGLIGYDKNLKHNPTNVEEAKEIIKTLPIEKKTLKLGIAQSKPLDLTKKIVEGLREVGFTVELEQMEFNALIEKSINTNDLNILFMGENYDLEYGHKVLCDYFIQGKGYNFCHVDEKDENKIKNNLEAGLKAKDSKTFEKSVQDVNKYIHDQFYIIPLYSSKNFTITTSKIQKGLKTNKFGHFDITQIKKI
ncbi:ABC-type peptide transport system, substrate-binding protein [Candidatus Phytoplasma asteris]|uniref:ABC-type peptide transport system, substrate-binding protein n=1 Tax=Candidatus Phytoplasma asteris TaxID=85620 RepID=A0ABZ2YFJ3_9MOLU